MLWIGGINLVWASVFFGVLVFALRTDTEAGHRDHRGPDRDPEPPPRPAHGTPGTWPSMSGARACGGPSGPLRVVADALNRVRRTTRAPSGDASPFQLAAGSRAPSLLSMQSSSSW